MANFSGMLNNYNLTVNVFASIDFSYIRTYAQKIKRHLKGALLMFS